MPQRDQVAGAFAGCRRVVEQNIVKIGAFGHAVQKDGGDSALPHVLEHGRVVPTRDDDQPVDFAPNQSADPLPLPGVVFLAVGEDELVVGEGGALCEASDDRGEKAHRDVGHHDADRARAALAQARRHRIRVVAERGDGFLNPLLQFRPDVTGAPQDVGHGRAGHARNPGDVVDGGAAVFGGTFAPGAHP